MKNHPISEHKKVSLTDSALSIIFAPGTVPRQFFRKLACDLADVDVYDIRYFVWGEFELPIEHAPVNMQQAMILTLVPFIGQTILCAAILMTVLTSFVYLADFSLPALQWFDFWAGMIIGATALPTASDADMFSEIPGKGAATMTSFISFLLFMRRAWIDFIYAAMVGLAIPTGVMIFLNFGSH